MTRRGQKPTQVTTQAKPPFTLLICPQLPFAARSVLLDSLLGAAPEADASIAGWNSLQRSFAYAPESVPVVRAMVRRFVDDLWGAGSEVGADAELVASELAANAVLHGGTGGSGCLDVRVSHVHGRLRIEVSDDRSCLPHISVTGAMAEEGRGLLLVEALCRRWGVTREVGPGADVGKIVWAEFDSALTPGRR
jgi:anti-sigma regulatory factor (Ser/Thr protein kinase)